MMYAGVVVAYNPDKEILDNINSYIDDVDKLYVVDNSEYDNSSMFKDLVKVEYIANMENLGIATALNIAAKKSINEGYNWLLTMDQDSHFDDHAINDMKAYIEFSSKTKEKLGIVSPFHLTPRSEDIINFNIISYPIVVMTSGNLVNLDAYQDIGGFVDWYFIDCVDFDFCLSMKKNGYEIVQINSAILNHQLGDTKKRKFLGKTLYEDNHNYVRRYYMIRNRYFFINKFKKFEPYYCKLENKSTIKEILSVLLYEKDKKRKLAYMYKGYKDFKKGLGGKIDNLYYINKEVNNEGTSNRC